MSARRSIGRDCNCRLGAERGWGANAKPAPYSIEAAHMHMWGEVTAKELDERGRPQDADSTGWCLKLSAGAGTARVSLNPSLENENKPDYLIRCDVTNVSLAQRLIATFSGPGVRSPCDSNRTMTVLAGV
ncbi:hypothetical protein J6590_020221 [Homalodisca vitripennis]|nr:hypothetical protein J6590_020221 [Homalodisca vitripennis]